MALLCIYFGEPVGAYPKMWQDPIFSTGYPQFMSDPLLVTYWENGVIPQASLDSA